MGDKKGAAKVVQNIVEPLGEAVKKEGSQVVRSALDQVGLANWLYGPEKKLSAEQLKQVAGSDDAAKNEQLNKIRAELGTNGKTSEQIPQVQTEKQPGTNQNQLQTPNPKAPISPDAKRMQIEHHQEAERLGVTEHNQERLEAQQKQVKQQEDAQKKAVKQERFEQPIEVVGKTTGAAQNPKKARARMQKRILQQSQTKGETRAGQGVGG